MSFGATSVIVEEVKQIALSIGMESNEMQNPIEFSTKLFDNLDELWKL
jgi:hypothetical protein